MKKKLIEIAQKAERISQMQWCDHSFLKGGYSRFAVWSLDDADADGLMFTGTYTEPETLDEMPELDNVNSGHLMDVVGVLHEYGRMTDDELRFIRREFGYEE